MKRLLLLLFVAVLFSCSKESAIVEDPILKFVKVKYKVENQNIVTAFEVWATNGTKPEDRINEKVYANTWEREVLLPLGTHIQLDVLSGHAHETRVYIYIDDEIKQLDHCISEETGWCNILFEPK